MGVFRNRSSSRPAYSDPSRGWSRWNPFRRRHRLPSFGPNGAGGPRRFVGRILLLPFRILLLALRLPVAVVMAVVDGWKQRRLRHLAQALPAAFALIAVTSAAGAIWLGRADLIPDYRQAAAAAFAGGDFKAARSYYERLHGLDGGTADTRFNLAMTYEKLGEDARAEAMMRRLIAGAAAGEPRAHLWFAKRLLSDVSAEGARERLAAAHRHLLGAYEASPKGVEPNVALAQYYLAVRDDASAVAHLELAAVASPALYFDLAAVFERMEREESMLRAAAMAEAHYARVVRSGPQDHAARIRWSTCLVKLGRFDEGIDALRQGYMIDPKQPYADLISRAYVERYDQLKRDVDPRPGMRLEMLRQALASNPMSEAAIVRLIEFSEEPAGAGSAAESRRILEETLAAGELPAGVHLALGIQAWKKEDESKARWHLERAYELDSSLAVVSNNLAWVLAFRDEPDTDRALRVIDAVIARWPDVPTYRDTRGQIYAKIGRWDEALTELERAVPGMNGNPMTHKTLSEAYRRAGNEDLARLHEQKAEESATESPPKAGQI